MAPEVTNEEDINSVHHPLFFHQNDNPGLVLISKKLTGSENFSTWRRSMMIALNAKNKLKIVTGEYKEPDQNLNLKNHWDRANDMLISWILNTVSEQIGNNLSFVNSAADLWNELYEHYSQLDGHIIYQISNEIVQLQQGNGSIEMYYHKLKGLWDELDALEAPYVCICKCYCENGKTNGERDQRKRLIQFLMGLDESYSNIRGQILLLQPLPNVSKAYSMIRQEERQREIQNQSVIAPTALNTTSGSYHNSKRTFGNSNQKYTDNTQSEKRSQFKKGVMCSYCGREGHTKTECYKVVGYPPNHPLHNRYMPLSQKQPQSNKVRSVNMTLHEDDTPLDNFDNSTSETDSTVHMRMDQLQNQLNQVLSMLQSKDTPTQMAGISSLIASHISNHKDTWIIDSGATDHICKSLSLMHYTRKCHPPILVALPNCHTTEVHIIGSVQVSPSLTLNEVLHIRSFAYNLISDHNGQITQGNLSGGYTLQHLLTKQPQHTSFSCSSDVYLWHARLGHPSLQVLKQIKSIPVFSSCNTDFNCNICPLSKQHVLPFNSSHSHASKDFELIHVDVWGPYRCSTINKCTYFLTIVDDYSRAIWTFLIPSKHHVSSTIKNFHAYTQAQFESNIKIIRSDNGTEFLNS